LAVVGAASRARAEHVVAAYAAPDAEANELELTLQSALDLPALTHELRRVAAVDARALIIADPSAPEALARIWVDFARDGKAFVYVVDRSWTRTYIRSLPRTPGNTALDCAQVGEIVRSAVQALQEGAVIGIAIEHAEAQLSSGEAPSVAPAPAPAAAPHGTRARFGFGASYAVALRASGELSHGPGLYAYALAQGDNVAIGGMLSAAYRPHRIEGQGLEARLDTVALRAGPVLELGARRTLAPRVAILGGVDLLHLDPSAHGDAVDAGAERVLAYPMLAVLAGLRARLTRDVELMIDFALDVDLVDTRYVRDANAGPRVVEDPFAVRPALQLDLGFY
jgi:hypothetical protein